MILRWHIQIGNLAIPKTTHKSRLLENFNVFDFELTETEMISIASLDSGMRLGPSPDELN